MQTQHAGAIKEPRKISDKPLFLDFVVDLPTDVQLARARKGAQMAECIRYDGNSSKSVDD